MSQQSVPGAAAHMNGVDNPLQQAQEVSQRWLNRMSAGEVWALIDANWFNGWASYAGFNPRVPEQIGQSVGGRPSEIDNARLSDPESPAEIRKDAVENRDYALVPAAVWDYLHHIYGGGPEYKRGTIEVGIQKRARLDLFPQVLQIVWADEKGEPEAQRATVTISRKLTFKHLVRQLQGTDANMAGGLDDDDEGATPTVRLWLQDKDDATKWTLLEGDDLNILLDNFQLPSRTLLLAERKKADGSWRRQVAVKDWRDFQIGDVIDARDTVQKWYESTIRDVRPDKVFIHFNGWAANWDEWIDRDSDRLAARGTHTTGARDTRHLRLGWGGNQEGRPEERGAVGLANLGNTCFMNSTLQCLSNTPILTEFFLSDDYLAQINRDNPLGWHGRIADEYGSLLKDLWSGKYTVVSPSKFKEVLGEFQPRFSGYQQQDSSELLQFLLDGLHEDLNQIRKKPATQAVESNNRPDAVVAAHAWDTHQLRNKSIIVDHLMGQLKSRLVCPVCSRVSITFDPFMFLSVPLPAEKEKVLLVAYIPAGRKAAPKLYAVSVPKEGKLTDLKDAMSKLTGANPKTMLALDVFHSRAYRVLEDRMLIADIQANDQVYVYEVPQLAPSPGATDMEVDDAPRAANGGDDSDDEPGVVGPRRQQDSYNYYSSGLGGIGRRHGLAKGPYPVQLVMHKAERNPYYGQYEMAREYDVLLAGTPLVIAVPPAVTCGEVRKLVAEAMKPYLKPSGADAVPYEIIVLNELARSTEGTTLSANDADTVVPGADGKDDRHFALGVRFTSFESDYDDIAAWENLTQDATVAQAKKAAETRRRDATTLVEGLRLFNQEEVLSKAEAWYCSSCKDHVCASKKFDVWKLPDVLVVHLKRFYNTHMWTEKIDTFVDFPVNGLDMAPFCVNPDEKDTIYDLYAISNHYGNMGGGHYTAFCRNLINHKWYDHDDSRVSPVGEKDLKSPAAYVLYYVRRSRVEAEASADMPVD